MKPELWKSIKNFPDYEVSDIGRIRSLKFGKIKILKPKLIGSKNNNYLSISAYKNLKRYNCKIHIAVLETFAGPRPLNHDVAHNDGNRFNNHISNLRWATRKENQNDKINHGTHVFGQKVWRAALTEDQVRFIKTNYKFRSEKFSAKNLAKKFGVASSCIFKVIHGITWVHVK